ncbi:MAG: DUF5591 domain-containing protein [Candidatus Aenigmatarchaeota archaeon]
MEKTLLLTSGRCAWGECFACGWGRLIGPPPSMHRLKNILDEKFREFKKEKITGLKVFSSGSFLDDKQFPAAIRRYLVKKCIEHGIRKLTVESRPEFVTPERLADFSGINLTVAIGLEVADNELLKKYHKGFTIEDYIKAAEILHAEGCKLRTYLMVGLPFVENHAATVKKSVEFARKHSDSIVLINTFPHSAAPIFDMWISGKWKPLDRKQFNDIVRNYPDCEIEFDNFAFVPKFHKEKQEFIKGATEKQLLHPHFEVWQDYFVRFYDPPDGLDIALFIPCAFRKPYRNSRLHRAIFSMLEKMKIFRRLHVIVISSPGVIPYEFSNHYPFTSYDWPEWEETPEIKKRYIEVVQRRIENYLKAHGRHYKKIYSYLKPDSESYTALCNACKSLGIDIVNCLSDETYEKIKGEKNPLALKEALDDMKHVLEKG